MTDPGHFGRALRQARLARFIPEIVEVMERVGEFQLTQNQREKLPAISAATIDRRLARERRRLGVKGVGRHQARDAHKAPDPHPDLRRVRRGAARVLRG